MSAALDRLLALPRFATAGATAYAPGLDRMRALLAAMGDPERAYPSVHVAGTNGKGSTASFVASIAQAAGLRVGLHTSPHLVRVEERMRLDGVPAPTEWLEQAVDRYAHAFERIGPSFFEATTALSLLYFAEARVDLAVVEVGLGGRLDATNVLAPVASLITSVGLDHTDLLGDTLGGHRAREGGHRQTRRPAPARRHRRRGAHEPSKPSRPAPARRSRTSARRAASRPTARCPHRDATAPTMRASASAFQARIRCGTPSLAVRAAEIAVPGLRASEVADGLANVVRRSGIRGRGEEVVARHPAGRGAQRRRLARRARLGRSRRAPGRLFALVGLMADKDADALALRLGEAGAVALPIGLDGDRALGQAALRACCARTASRPCASRAPPRRSGGSSGTARPPTCCS